MGPVSYKKAVLALRGWSESDFGDVCSEACVAACRVAHTYRVPFTQVLRDLKQLKEAT